MYPNGYVSGSIKRLRKRLQENPDKAKAFKEEVTNTVAFGLEDFDKRLRRGEVKIDNVGDYEKLVKLGLLLYGEATEKIEHTTDIEEVSTEQYEAVKDTPEFEEVMRKLALSMNAQNEEG